MNKVSDVMQPILDTICPPKKTIWVLIFKTHAEQLACDFTAFWFEKPTPDELGGFGFKDGEIETLLSGMRFSDNTGCVFKLQEVVANCGYISSTVGLIKMADGAIL